MTLSIETSLSRRRVALCATVVLCALGLPCQVGADDSLARSVPAEVGLFAEVRNAGDLLTRLTDPQIWTTLAELAGQPARPEDVADWRRRIQQTVKMKPEEAIHALFSQSVAFVGEGPGRAQDAVVLCRPNHEVTTAELLTRWNASRLRQPQRPPTYRLYSNIGVSEHNGLLIFGDLIPKEGLFRRLQQFTADAQPKALADDPVYKKLLARVPRNPDGVLFARLGLAAPILVPTISASSQPTSQPTLSDLPGPLRNAKNIMLALHREGSLLHFTAVGDAPGKDTAKPARPVRLIESLPERTLLAWQGRVDFSKPTEAFLQTREQNPIPGVFQLPEQIETLDRFIKSLDTSTCVAIGPIYPAGRPTNTPPLPAIALLAGTHDPATTLAEMRGVANIGMLGYTLFAFGRGLPLLQPIDETRLGDTPVFVLDLSPLLKPTAGKAIGQIQLCWMVHNNVLIITSHLDWLRRIVAARNGHEATLAKVILLSRGTQPLESVNAFVIQSGPISDIAAAWLEYLKRTKPEVFSEAWWRNRQPGGGHMRLGINVTTDDTNRRLRLNEVFENQPASGRLKVGDFIVGYGNRRFTTDDLIAEITTAIQERPHARWMELLIERDGVTQRMRLPLPFIDPMQFLHRIVAIGKIAQRAVYRDDQSDPAGPRGFLTIELRTSEKPLFEFPQPIPIGSTSKPSD